MEIYDYTIIFTGTWFRKWDLKEDAIRKAVAVAANLHENYKDDIATYSFYVNNEFQSLKDMELKLYKKFIKDLQDVPDTLNIPKRIKPGRIVGGAYGYLELADRVKIYKPPIASYNPQIESPRIQSFYLYLKPNLGPAFLDIPDHQLRHEDIIAEIKAMEDTTKLIGSLELRLYLPSEYKKIRNAIQHICK